MKTPPAFFVSLIFSLALCQGAEAQVTSNVLERVLNVRVGKGTSHEGKATAFTLDLDGREYLITAKHVVKELKSDDQIEVFSDDKWLPIQVKIFRCEDPIDIAVLIPPYQLTVNFPLSFGNTFFFGQEAYFVGFPYGMQSSAQGINGPYPLPIIRRGAFAGRVAESPAKKAIQLLLDGFNNPGFSGSPVVYREPNQGEVVMNVAAVISGFKPDISTVMKEHNIRSKESASPAAKAEPWRIIQRANGSWFELVDSDKHVVLNTAIVSAYEISPAIDLIRQHPIGPEAKDLPNNRPK
jgi:S1-C subfamily serine protease